MGRNDLTRILFPPTLFSFHALRNGFRHRFIRLLRRFRLFVEETIKRNHTWGSGLLQKPFHQTGEGGVLFTSIGTLGLLVPKTLKNFSDWPIENRPFIGPMGRKDFR